VAEEPAGEKEETELRSRGIFLAASAMGLMRGIVGFLVFLLAFEYQEEPTWKLGLAVGASVLGSFIGSILAPRVRRTTHEEDILTGSLIIAAGVSLLGAWSGGLLSAMLVALTIGFCANTAKLAFDSIVQRDAPDANRGRSFARFETRFQVWWVIGAFIPVVLPILKIPLPAQAGFLIIALTAGFAGATYWLGRRDAAAGRTRTKRPRRRPPADVSVAAVPPEPTMVDDFLPPPDPTPEAPTLLTPWQAPALVLADNGDAITSRISARTGVGPGFTLLPGGCQHAARSFPHSACSCGC
jgi:hypothetical protein